MSIKIILKNFILSALIFSAVASLAVAQNTKISAPRQEKLLNGLKLLIWTEPTNNTATVKLRIHSGAAFDTLNKEGTMALLADILFPNESTREFFQEDLNGSFEVVSNYDFIQINATGNAEQILTILETLATALTKPQINKETTAKVRTARLARVAELEKNPSYVADRAVAKRLFGDFPYGRSAEGTSASLAKIDFADLLLAEQRFLTADNATLAVSGNVKPDFISKAVRQLFGGWEKSSKKIPATFAEPTAPDSNLQVINPTALNSANEVRFAFSAFGRNHKDFIASKILVETFNDRLQKENSTGRPNAIFIRQDSYFLSGLTIIGLSNVITDAESQLNEKPPITHIISVKQENLAQELLASKVSAEEFQNAKTKITAEMSRKDAADYWLDTDTYKTSSSKDELQKINDITLADVQRVANDLLKQSFVKIWLLNHPTTAFKN